MKHQILLGVILFSFFFLNFIGASDLGSFQRGETIKLYQQCENCTYVNLTTIIYPNQTLKIGQHMDSNGEDYTYSFSDTTLLGNYKYTTCGDKNGILRCEVNTFSITSSGREGTENIVFMMFLIIFIYAITFIGFFGKNEIITLMGALSLFWIGLYTITNGIIIYQDWITNAMSYISIGLGGYMSFMAASSLWEDL